MSKTKSKEQIIKDYLKKKMVADALHQMYEYKKNKGIN